MKSILIEDLIAMKLDECQTSVEFSDENGKRLSGWAIAKPLNLDKDYISEEDRKAMAQEVLDGHAIAVHFTQDEIDCGEVPISYKRWRESQKASSK